MGMSDVKARDMSTMFSRHDQALIDEALKHPIEIDALIAIGV
jgi:hypothetical protein